jgi:hypothetical protein
MNLFRHKKQPDPHKVHPNLYSKHYYFTKELSNIVDWVAETDRTSKKRAAELLMSTGFSVWVTDKLKLFPSAQQDLNKRIEYNRFIRTLLKFAKENNLDLSKYFPYIPNPPENIPPKTP